jgi:hypothetical protein
LHTAHPTGPHDVHQFGKRGVLMVRVSAARTAPIAKLREALSRLATNKVVHLVHVDHAAK